MPYPDANAYSVTTPSTSLDPRSNGLPGLIGNAHTGRCTANDLDGQPMPPYNYSHNGVVFDGTNDYLLRGGNLTGLVAGRYLTIAGSFIHAAGATGTIVEGVGGGVNVSVTSGTSGTALAIIAFSATAGYLAPSPNRALIQGERVRFVYSMDAIANTAYIWINGTEGFAAPGTWLGTINVPFNSLTNWAVGAQVSAGNKLNGTLNMVWVGAHYVTSAAAFFAGNSDRDLGTDGTLTGLPAPLLFFGGRQTFTNWNAGTNQGTGGNFTMNGSVVAA